MAEATPLRSVPKEGLLALAAAILLAGGGITTALVLTRERSAPPVAAKENLEETKRRDDERSKIDSERKALEQEKRKLDVARLMNQASVALSEKRFADAEKAYGDVLKLTPDDAEAVAGLANVRVAMAGDSKLREEKTARDADYARLMSQGKDALAKKQLAAAARSFAMAGRAKPGDGDAAAALAETEQAVAAADVEKRKMADYLVHMDAGKSAVAAKRYQDAIQAFLAAQRVLPGDEAATTALKQAEDRLKDQQERDKRQAQFAGLMEKAQFALRNRRFDTAIDAFEGALRLFPDDREAKQALRETKQRKTDAKKEFAKLMAQGNAAMQNQRIEEAARAYNGAAALFPDDLTAGRMVKQLDQLLGNIQTNQAAYLRFITRGTLALRTGLYADAVRAYAEALGIAPNDFEALVGLREAQAGLNGAVVGAGNYQALMTLGTQALQQRRFGEAVKSFGDALEVAPGDLAATNALRQARYQHAMARGQNALATRRLGDAARFFQDALREVPGDIQAATALRQAQALRR